MVGLKILSVVLGTFVLLPLWFLFLYKLLVHVNATETLWFIYWVYMPIAFVVQFNIKLAEVFEEIYDN